MAGNFPGRDSPPAQDTSVSLPKYEDLIKEKQKFEEAFKEGKNLVIKDAICATVPRMIGFIILIAVIAVLILIVIITGAVHSDRCRGAPWLPSLIVSFGVYSAIALFILITVCFLFGYNTVCDVIGITCTAVCCCLFTIQVISMVITIFASRITLILSCSPVLLNFSLTLAILITIGTVCCYCTLCVVGGLAPFVLEKKLATEVQNA